MKNKIILILICKICLISASGQFINHNINLNSFYHIDKNEREFYALNTTISSFLYYNYNFKTFLPKSQRLESFITIFNKNEELIDSLHFYSKYGTLMTATNLDNMGNYYFVIHAYDTLFSTTGMIYKPVLEQGNSSVFVFKYNIQSKNVELLKVIGNGFFNSVLFVDSLHMFMGIDYGDTAYVDSLSFPPYFGGIHESNIIWLKINISDHSISESSSIIGFDEKIPRGITADANGNTYLCTDIYSPFLVYAQDTIQLQNVQVGNGVLFKFDTKGQLAWYHTTHGYFLQSLPKDNGGVYTMGNYAYYLNVDTTLLTKDVMEDRGFMMSFDKDGKYESFFSLDGVGERKFNLLKNGRPQEIVLAGTFKNKIFVSPTKTTTCNGATDAYVYLLDQSGIFKNSFYFQGDSTEEIIDVVPNDEDGYFILGSTNSKTLICGQDTLFLIDHNKTYFIYEIKASVLNATINKTEASQNIVLFPNPILDKLTIIVNKAEVSYPMSWNVFDLNGNLIHHFKMDNNMKDINGTNWMRGTYFLEGRDKNGISFTRKICKY